MRGRSRWDLDATNLARLLGACGLKGETPRAVRNQRSRLGSNRLDECRRFRDARPEDKELRDDHISFFNFQRRKFSARVIITLLFPSPRDL
jgi:hypothetical protein